MSSAERPRRETWHDLKRQRARYRIASQVLIDFRWAVQRCSSERVARVPVAPCSVVRMWVACQAAEQGWPAAGICRGDGGLHHHCLTLLCTPIGKEDVPEMGVIHLHVVSPLPHERGDVYM